MQGIIFDFNGTMFFDTPKHKQAFKLLIKETLKRDITDEEFNKNINGRSNKLIFKYLYNNNISDYDILKYSCLKEEIYRKLCIEDKENFHLANGLPELLDFLKSKNIPLGIATSSDKTNTTFYIKSFNLLKWFDINNITYNDGTIKSKPNPEIFLKACKNLGINPQDCIVFEDTFSGVNAAINAGVKNIISIATNNTKEFNIYNEVILNIKDYKDNELEKLLIKMLSI